MPNAVFAYSEIPYFQRPLFQIRCWAGVVYVNQLPASSGFVIDLRLPAVCFNRGSIITLFSDEVPIELDPCRIAVHMDGHITHGQPAFRKGCAEKAVKLFYFLPAVCMASRVNE